MWIHLERHIYYFNRANGVPIWQAVFSKLDRFNTLLFYKRLWRIRALCGRCFDGGATLRKLHATLQCNERSGEGSDGSPFGSATEVMLAMSFRATVGQKPNRHLGGQR